MGWGAILAGGAAAAALSLILLILGTGLGLSAVSPWAQNGVTAATLGVSAILWVTVTQVLAAGMGGFLAGRLRSAWSDVHADEVYFRDSAHGFLAWAVASLATAALLTSVIGGIVGGSVKAASTVVSSVASSAAPAVASAVANTPDTERSSAVSYAVDSLFRPGPGGSTAAQQPPASEVNRIVMNALRTGALPAEDASYLAQRVAAQTGLAPADAQTRVTEVVSRLQATLRAAETQAIEAADKARKAAAYSALWLFISLLMGAFVASVAAIWGGRERDR